MSIPRELEGVAFGLTDGVICFLGTIAGVAAATNSATLIILAGFIAGIADAFGNSIGFYVSQSTEQGIQEYYNKEKDEKAHVHSDKELLESSVGSFIATLAVLVLLLIPFFFVEVLTALAISTVSSLIVLFLLGYYVAGFSKQNKFKKGAIYAILGLAGAVITYIIGTWLKSFLGL